MYGSNKKPPTKRVSFIALFFGALDDFMLKLLLVCACVSISIDVGFADPGDRSHGKFNTIRKFVKKVNPTFTIF